MKYNEIMLASVDVRPSEAKPVKGGSIVFVERMIKLSTKFYFILSAKAVRVWQVRELILEMQWKMRLLLNLTVKKHRAVLHTKGYSLLRIVYPSFTPADFERSYLHFGLDKPSIRSVMWYATYVHFLEKLCLLKKFDKKTVISVLRKYMYMRNRTLCVCGYVVGTYHRMARRFPGKLTMEMFTNFKIGGL